MPGILNRGSLGFHGGIAQGLRKACRWIRPRPVGWKSRPFDAVLDVIHAVDVFPDRFGHFRKAGAFEFGLFSSLCFHPHAVESSRHRGVARIALGACPPTVDGRHDFRK